MKKPIQGKKVVEQVRSVKPDEATYVGMDTHKKSINVAMLIPGEAKVIAWTVANEPKALKRMVRKIEREAPGEVRCCYEAGPCGYALQRFIHAHSSITCEVIAPSLIPLKPGDRIKTDRRDAKKLAELLQARLLTEVRPPTEEDEAIRDLCRCREAAQKDLTRARHRMAKLLLRRGLQYTEGKKDWTQMHKRWLRSLSFEHPADQMVFEDYFQAIEHAEERVRQLTDKMKKVAQKEPYKKIVGWLSCFRGFDTVTALSLVAELHDFRRFQSAKELMSYLGLTPSEYSSGGRTKRGSITKAGNSHARRLLIEASWHYRHKPAVGARLRVRRKGQPGDIIAIADRAQKRLHKRFWRLTESRGKEKNKAIVAMARELTGFIWAALYPKEAQSA